MWLDWSNAMSITISITTYIIEIARPFLYLRVCSNTTPIRLFVTNLCHESLGAKLLPEIHKLQRTARFPAFMRPHFDVSPSRDDLEMFPHQSVKSQSKFVRINQNFDVCKSTAFFCGPVLFVSCLCQQLTCFQFPGLFFSCLVCSLVVLNSKYRSQRPWNVAKLFESWKDISWKRLSIRHGSDASSHRINWKFPKLQRLNFELEISRPTLLFDTLRRCSR